MTLLPPVLLTTQTAERLGIAWYPNLAVLADHALLTPDQEQKLDETVRGFVPNASAYTERWFRPELGLILWVLAAAGLIAVLIGSLTVTGLALVDARPDLATLAAVGGSPRTRRLLAGSHALIIGLLGTMVGIGVGFLPGLAVTVPLTTFNGTGPVIAIPWAILGVLAFAVPALVAVVAAVSHRTGQRLTRRLGY